jgi:hypothetical protein
VILKTPGQYRPTMIKQSALTLLTDVTMVCPDKHFSVVEEKFGFEQDSSPGIMRLSSGDG